MKKNNDNTVVENIPDTIELLELVRISFQNYVDKEWKRHQSVTVGDWNEVQPHLDYTLPQISNNYEKLNDSLESMNQAYDSIKKELSTYRKQLAELKDSNIELLTALVRLHNMVQRANIEKTQEMYDSLIVAQEAIKNVEPTAIQDFEKRNHNDMADKILSKYIIPEEVYGDRTWSAILKAMIEYRNQ